MTKETGAASGGIGFFSLLAVAFIVLKLTGTIGWSWWWVLAPVWGPFALVFLVVFVLAFVEEMRQQ